EIVETFKKLWKYMNISYDRYIRTTDDYHIETVQKIFKELYDKGYIYKGEYKGKYCTPCESFWTDSQLVDGKCPECGREVIEAKEEAYFFKMSPFADQITHLLTETDYLQPKTRATELVNNFIKPGLQDLCVSRTSFKWGIPVEFDPGHVIYVWIDALSNYITALGYDPDGSGELYKKYWPADVHIIGKDIVRFHTIYWPIMLMALGEPLPKQVFGHPWLLFGEDKMSKSKGNVIYADDLVKLFGVDAVRYYLLSEMPYAADGSITYDTMIERYNSDLANTLGNLVNRTIAMTNKYFGGIIQPASEKEPVDDELINEALDTLRKVDELLKTYRVSDALEAIFNLAKRSNKYIDETMPWALAKDESKKARLGTVLYNLLESIRFISVLVGPFMPDTAEAIRKQMNCSIDSYDSLESFGALEAGAKVGDAVPLFARIDVKEMAEKIAALTAPKEEKKEESKHEQTPPAEKIGIDAFAKVEMRVGKVLECENVKKSSKLLKFLIDDGTDAPRTIVSGIAKWYKPQELIGKNIVFVSNLKPAKLCGIESNGMILSAECSEDSVKLITVDESIPAGSVIG
ncbi:MAG: methionine--tRNA ligase, partial [Acutalibacteraceae bacterium]